MKYINEQKGPTNTGEKLKSKLEEYLGPIADITEGASLIPGEFGELMKITNYAINMSNKCNERKVQALLAGMSKNDTFDSETELNRLYGFAKDPASAQYIVEMFQKALLSSSIIAAILMGRQWSRIESQGNKIDQKVLVIFNALSELNDYDFRNFVIMMKCFESNQTNDIHFNMGNISAEKKEEMEYSLQKFYRLQLLDMDSSNINDSGTLSMGKFYKKNGITDELQRIIDDSMGLINYYHLLEY